MVIMIIRLLLLVHLGLLKAVMRNTNVAWFYETRHANGLMNGLFSRRCMSYSLIPELTQMSARLASLVGARVRGTPLPFLG